MFDLRTERMRAIAEAIVDLVMQEAEAEVMAASSRVTSTENSPEQGLIAYEIDALSDSESDDPDPAIDGSSASEFRLQRRTTRRFLGRTVPQLQPSFSDTSSSKNLTDDLDDDNNVSDNDHGHEGGDANLAHLPFRLHTSKSSVTGSQSRPAKSETSILTAFLRTRHMRRWRGNDR